MKKLIFLFTLLLAFSTAGAVNKFDIHPVKKIEANPLNVAVMLTERPDSATMVSTLTYYGYQPASDDSSLKTQDLRLKTYTHPNGSIIRFTFTTAEDGKSYPTVEVKAKVTQKEKESILQVLNFKKNGNSYERKSITHTTRTSSLPQGYLRLSTHPKAKP